MRDHTNRPGQGLLGLPPANHGDVRIVVATPQLLDKPLVVRHLPLQRLGGAALLLALTLLLQLLDQLIHFHLEAVGYVWFEDLV